MKTKLNPCPNCGCEPSVVRTKYEGDRCTFVLIRCPHCFLETYNTFDVRDSAENWNDREGLHFTKIEFVPWEESE